MKKNRNKIILLILLCLLLTAISVYLFNKQKENNTRRRISLKQLHSALEMYAMANDGNFPAGQQTPEASLSLLYKDFLSIPDYLGGKSVDPIIPKRILEEGKLLGPDCCSWNYVEGLKQADSRDTAILWDKIPPPNGHGYAGKNPPKDSREVLYLDGHTEFIQESDWDTFLKKQKELHKQKKKATGTGIIAFIQGSGTLWTLNEDNYVFVRDKKVTWWGSAADWKKRTLSGQKLPSPRDVTKAPNPEQSYPPKEKAKHAKAYWQKQIDQVKLGMTRAEVEKLLPRLQDHVTGFTGGSYETHYWVDDDWKVSIGYDYSGDNRDEHGNGPGNKVLTLPKLMPEKRKVYKLKKVKGGYDIID